MKRVVLVRPEGPRNVGMALRAAANFGPCELVVVGPVRPSLLIHPDFEQMAHGVDGGADRVVAVASLSEALVDATHCIGFTARARGHRVLRDWRDARAGLRERVNGGERVALLFGSESAGLSGDDCARCGELVRIATADEHGSLNLAMAVTVVLCELYAGPRVRGTTRRGELLRGDGREYLRLHLRDALPGLTRSESFRRDLEASIDRIFSRAALETRDARAWHGLARALGNRKTPGDYGLVAGPGCEGAEEPPAVRRGRASRAGACATVGAWYG